MFYIFKLNKYMKHVYSKRNCRSGDDRSISPWLCIIFIKKIYKIQFLLINITISMTHKDY